MPFAEVNNIKICYEIQGEGYPIIIHGYDMMQKKKFGLLKLELYLKNLKLLPLMSVVVENLIDLKNLIQWVHL